MTVLAMVLASDTIDFPAMLIMSFSFKIRTHNLTLIALNIVYRHVTFYLCYINFNNVVGYFKYACICLPLNTLTISFKPLTYRFESLTSTWKSLDKLNSTGLVVERSAAVTNIIHTWLSSFKINPDRPSKINQTITETSL